LGVARSPLPLVRSDASAWPLALLVFCGITVLGRAKARPYNKFSPYSERITASRPGNDPIVRNVRVVADQRESRCLAWEIPAEVATRLGPPSGLEVQPHGRSLLGVVKRLLQHGAPKLVFRREHDGCAFRPAAWLSALCRRSMR
jgi:hypothetical protein